MIRIVLENDETEYFQKCGIRGILLIVLIPYEIKAI